MARGPVGKTDKTRKPVPQLRTFHANTSGSVWPRKVCQIPTRGFQRATGFQNRVNRARSRSVRGMTARFRATVLKPHSGSVAEWFKALVLKTSEPKGSVGSNPTASATQLSDLVGFVQVSVRPRCRGSVQGSISHAVPARHGFVLKDHTIARRAIGRSNRIGAVSAARVLVVASTRRVRAALPLRCRTRKLQYLAGRNESRLTTLETENYLISLAGTKKSRVFELAMSGGAQVRSASSVPTPAVFNSRHVALDPPGKSGSMDPNRQANR